MDDITPEPTGIPPVCAASFPTTERVRPCDYIEPEPNDGSIVVTSVADRFADLLQPLPLAGASALTLDHTDEIALARHLRNEAPWLGPAIDVINAQLRLQLWAGRPWVSFRPLLLVGPPGCGKSHLARLISKRAAIGHATLDLAGTSDNRTLEGTARGWTTAQPCFPAVTINRTRTVNPIICLEEIDKAGGSARNGDPLATILTMIEPSTSQTFFDKCLMAPVDLSHVNWLMTANEASRLPAPLRSRLDLVHVTAPGAEHFDALLGNVLRDLGRRWALPVDMLPAIDLDIERSLRERFARHRSVRRLAREVEIVLATLIRFSPRRAH